PTLNPYPRRSSDSVLVNCWAVRQFEGIDRGDIVTLIDPTDPGSVLIKRVIALEGDHVRSISYKKKIVKIPRGHCWVEGDNHSHSLDSNSFGSGSGWFDPGKRQLTLYGLQRDGSD
ncbi:Mitochondrial inner membrane protease subunit 2, partial [Desmophyllum pertusum]